MIQDQFVTVQNLQCTVPYSTNKKLVKHLKGLGAIPYEKSVKDFQR